MATKTLKLDRIRIDGGTQQRAKIDQATVEEYAEAYQAKASMPPVTVFWDGKEYWLGRLDATGVDQFVTMLAAGFLPAEVALKNGIPLVFFGENGEAEYGGDPSANDKPCWDFKDWERVYLKGGDVWKLVKIGKTLGALTDSDERRISEFYSLPQGAVLSGVQFHWLGHYLKWHPQANFYHAAEHTGFEPNPEGRSEGTYSKYASLDDKTDGFHYWMAYMKFGIGRATSDAAHEVREGDLTREEAVALVRKYDGEFPNRHYREVLDYLGLSEDQFARVVERYRNPRIFDGHKLRHPICNAEKKADSETGHTLSESH